MANRSPSLEAADKLRSRSAEHLVAADDWLRRWFLSLAVGNGGRLLAMGSLLSNGWGRGDVWLPVLPALWAFAIGLTCAGYLPLRNVREMRFLSNDARTRAHEAEEGGVYHYPSDNGDDPVASTELLAVNADQLRRAVDARLAIQWTSAGAFLFGLFWPLVVATLRGVS